MLHTTSYKGFYIHSAYNNESEIHRVQFSIELLLSEDKFMLGEYSTIRNAKVAITNELKKNPIKAPKSLDKVYMK